MKTKQHLHEYPCRGTLHWMEHVPCPADFVMPNSDYWRGADDVLHYRCDRCGTERHIALDYLGEILADKYDHRPAGYSLPAVRHLDVVRFACGCSRSHVIRRER